MNPYLSMFLRSRRKGGREKSINGVPVRRQQTCPACGKSLVNTYKRYGVWRCGECWKKVQG